MEETKPAFVAEQSGRRPMRKWLRRSRLCVEAAVIVAALFGWLARLHPLFDLSTHAAFHLLVLSICCLAFELFQLAKNRTNHQPKSILWTLLIAVSFASFTYVVQPWTLLETAPKSTSKHDGLKVMCWNILLVNNSPTEIIEILKNEQPDIAILLEVSQPMGTELEAIRSNYACNFWNPAWSSGGIVILSRLPGVEFREVPLARIGNLAIEFEVPESPKSQRYRILAVHTLSPITFDRATWRDRQMKTIGEWLLRSEEASCAIGDYNTTPWSPGFRDLLKSVNIHDTRVGYGLLATWPSYFGVLGVPIDHALINSNARLLDRRVAHPWSGSDHCPIFVTLE